MKPRRITRRTCREPGAAARRWRLVRRLRVVAAGVSWTATMCRGAVARKVLVRQRRTYSATSRLGDRHARAARTP